MGWAVEWPSQPCLDQLFSGNVAVRREGEAREGRKASCPQLSGANKDSNVQQ